MTSPLTSCDAGLHCSHLQEIHTFISGDASRKYERYICCHCACETTKVYVKLPPIGHGPWAPQVWTDSPPVEKPKEDA
jgi:hypothetical protein